MKHKKPLFKRPVLPYANFISRMRTYQYTGLSLPQLQNTFLHSHVLEEQFAVLAAIIQRLKGLSLFDTQLAAAYSMYTKHIAELPTGEGKTLSTVVTAACLALEGHNVHVLVFNDYLAKRDYYGNRDIYEACGFTCGYITQHSTKQQRQTAYACNITYVSAKEAGFDYLRDFLCLKPEDCIFPGFDVAIVDEADSILIDEAKTPLVLAGATPWQKDRAAEVQAAVVQLKSSDVEIDKNERQVWLTDAGIATMESLLRVDLYKENSMEILASVQNALEAQFLLVKDEDYIVKDNAVQIIEPTTGRVVLNRRYPDLLHRAVEIKENLSPTPLTTIYNSITMHNFISLYPAYCGMTGTISTSSGEIWNAYGLDIDTIPPHIPSIRQDHSDVICVSEEEHKSQLLQHIQQAHKKMQPILLATQSVSQSESISMLLNSASIPHVVLNAKNDAEEAAVIAQAGIPGRVTISTNMAGRGVDIKLGGPHEAQRQTAINAGGLYVIGTGIYPCIRIDNQLRGRAGRQGDPGESRFFICLQDGEAASRVTALQLAQAKTGQNHFRASLVRQIQAEVESEAAQERYSLQKYGYIIEQQRQEISEWRLAVLQGKNNITYLQEADPEIYKTLCHSVREAGVTTAQRQLALYYSNQHWAGHLATMEAVRGSAQFMAMGPAIGRKSPLDEYHRAATASCEEMLLEIKKSVVSGMQTLPVTKNGIDMEDAGLTGGSTTWSYSIDDSSNQFNRLRGMLKRAYIKATNETGILTKLYSYLHNP